MPSAALVTLVGTAEYYLLAPNVPPFTMFVIAIEVILGSLTFTGSLMAAGKLQEILPQRPITFPRQNYVNLSLLVVSIFVAAHLVSFPEKSWLFPVILVVPLIFGVLMIVPIGGADMPTVISLLNSYAGLSAAAMGFVIHNKLLIVAGALDGASGFILSVNMSKAMNRSFSNVLFGAFGQQQIAAAADAAEAPPSGARRPKKLPASSRPPPRSSSCPDTAWPSPRPSTRSENFVMRHQARGRRQIRHPPRRGTDARPHERPAGRGRHPLR